MVEVALTENILDKPNTIINTQSASLVRDGTLITKTVQRSSDGTSTVYTVPKNKIFFLISANINGHNDDTASTGIGHFFLDSISSDRSILELQIGFGHELGAFDGSVHNSVSQNYPIPLKIEEGKALLLTLSGGSDLIASVTIAGYEINKEIAFN